MKNKALDTASSVASSIGDGIRSIFPEGRSKEYTADFIPAGKILSNFNKGFTIAGRKALSIGESHSNCSVFGASGSGKSSTVLIPSVFSLARGKSTICVHDPSEEIFEKVSGYLSRIGYSVLYLNFSNPALSEKFNPLMRCKTVSDIAKVIHLVISNTVGSGKADPFWDRSAEMLCTLFARFLLFYRPKEEQTLNHVLRLVETFLTSEEVDRQIAAANDPELFSAYKAFIGTNDKTLQSIVATARAALGIFSDPTIIEATSNDTIDFPRFREEKIALFICNPIKDISYYSALSALFFNSLFGEIMSKIPAPTERSIFILLEEGATMKFSGLSTTISNVRKYRAGIMLVVQDYQSLVNLYGAPEAHNIRSNTYAQIFLKGQSLASCKELETILGRFNYTDEKSGNEKLRMLMSADEIRQLDEAIVLCGNHPPIKAKMTPYYQRIIMGMRVRIPPYMPIRN